MNPAAMFFATFLGLWGGFMVLKGLGSVLGIHVGREVAGIGALSLVVVSLLLLAYALATDRDGA